MSRRVIVLLGGAACALGLAAVQPVAVAQTLQEQELEQTGLGREPSSGDWNVTLGAGLAVAPRYPGADTDRTRLVPLGDIVYRHRFFLGPAGLGVSLIDSGGFRAGPVLGFMPGRSETRDAELTGLGDIRSSISAGVFLRYRTGRFEVGSTVREAITHTDNGLVGLVRADYRLTPGRSRLQLFLGPDLEYANARHTQTWFGVTPVQSLDSGLPVFTPGAGVKEVGLHANLTYRYTDHVLLRTFANLRDLTGDIRNSPIVERRTQLLVGAGLAYHFQ
jgi:MipA family protein